MWWTIVHSTDFGGYQIEIVFALSIFIIMAIWVFYNSDKYLFGVKRHLSWLLTIATGPIGLLFYLIIRRKEK